MRIMGRDLRRVINEEVRRSMKLSLREIRVDDNEEQDAASDEYTPYEEDPELEGDHTGDDDSEEDERNGMYESVQNSLGILMATMPSLSDRSEKVMTGLEDIYVNGKDSRHGKAVLRTLEKIKTNWGGSHVGKMGIASAIAGGLGALAGGAVIPGVGAAGGAALGMGATAWVEKVEDKKALAVISSLCTGRVAGLEPEESEYYLDVLDVVLSWYWDTPFEDKYQEVKFIETLVKFINSN